MPSPAPLVNPFILHMQSDALASSVYVPVHHWLFAGVLLSMQELEAFDRVGRAACDSVMTRSSMRNSSNDPLNRRQSSRYDNFV